MCLLLFDMARSLQPCCLKGPKQANIRPIISPSKIRPNVVGFGQPGPFISHPQKVLVAKMTRRGRRSMAMEPQNQIPPPKFSHPHTHTHFHTHHLSFFCCCPHHPPVHHHHHHHHSLHHFHPPLLFFHHHHHPLPLSPAYLPPQASNGEEQVAATSAVGLEQEDLEQNLELEEEEEGDDVFVMTDEWKDFFAKSEAKRRLKKQQSKKGSK